jgi:hypothetical protein
MVMTHAFAAWLGRFLIRPSRPLIQPLPPPRQPMTIEVERLADYRWRELGFSQPERRSAE